MAFLGFFCSIQLEISPELIQKAILGGKTSDLKSVGPKGPCGFESRHRQTAINFRL